MKIVLTRLFGDYCNEQSHPVICEEIVRLALKTHSYELPNKIEVTARLTPSKIKGEFSITLAEITPNDDGKHHSEGKVSLTGNKVHYFYEAARNLIKLNFGSYCYDRLYIHIKPLDSFEEKC